MNVSPKVVCFVSMLFLISSLTACAQANLKDISASDEVSIRYVHPATKGTTKKYRTDVTSIPKAPLLPSIYSSVPDRTYLIETDIIDLGDPILTFKVPIQSEAEFGKVRILRLLKDDFSATGYQWEDCTITLEAVRSRIRPETITENPEDYAAYIEESKPQFPNFSRRTVNCQSDADKWSEKEYVAAVIQNGDIPKVAFTDIRLRLDGSTDAEPPIGETSYKLVIENLGSKDAAEVNLHSTFGIDMQLLAVVPSQGSCGARGRGMSGEICHLGKLPSKGSITINFRGRPSGHPNDEGNPTPINGSWFIRGVAKERASDSNWVVNGFVFTPLLKTPNN